MLLTQIKLSPRSSQTKGVDVDTHCVEYESGTALHIAASNLSIAAARVLLKFGANAEATDDLGRKPCESTPDPDTFDMVPDAQELIDRMTKLLSEGLETNAAQASVGSLVKSSTKSISGWQLFIISKNGIWQGFFTYLNIRNFSHSMSHFLLE